MLLDWFRCSCFSKQSLISEYVDWRNFDNNKRQIYVNNITYSLSSIYICDNLKCKFDHANDIDHIYDILVHFFKEATRKFRELLKVINLNLSLGGMTTVKINTESLEMLSFLGWELGELGAASFLKIRRQLELYFFVRWTIARIMKK